MTTDLVASPDGTKVAFVSEANNLVPDMVVPARPNVYVRDLTADTTTLVSRSITGSGGGDDESSAPVFSPDGTKLAFISRASDLVPLSTTVGAGANNVYVYDLAGATVSLVSGSPDGTERGNTVPTLRRDYGSYAPAFSPDSTRIAFVSEATNLTTTPDPHVCTSSVDSASCTDVFVRDLADATTSLVSVGTDGTAGNAWSGDPAFGPEGDVIAFGTNATNLLPDGGNGIVERDLSDGSTALLTTASGAPTYARSGSLVLFTATPSSVGFPGGYPTRGVFSVDRTSGELAQVSPPVASAITPGPSRLDVSPDGTRVLFQSSHSYVDIPDGNGQPGSRGGGDVFAIDLESGTTTPISVNAAGTSTGDGRSSSPSWSADGLQVAFQSEASDLDPAARQVPDSSAPEVYVRDLVDDRTHLVSARADGLGGGNGSATSASFLAADRVAFLSNSTDLDDLDDDLASVDVFVAESTGADLTVAIADVPDPVPSDGTLVYAVTVENQGPESANDVVVVLVLPEGVTYASSTPASSSCSPAPTNAAVVTCEVGNVAVAGVAHLEISADVEAPVGTELSVVAVADSPALDPTGAAVTESTTVG